MKASNDINVKTENVSKKLQQLKKLQASMNSDDISSQDITMGSSKKGTKIIMKTGKKNLNFADDLSVATIDSKVTKKTIKGVHIGPINRYNKSDLMNLATKHNVDFDQNMNKNKLYTHIKDTLKQRGY